MVVVLLVVLLLLCALPRVPLVGRGRRVRPAPAPGPGLHAREVLSPPTASATTLGPVEPCRRLLPRLLNGWLLLLWVRCLAAGRAALALPLRPPAAGAADTLLLRRRRLLLLLLLLSVHVCEELAPAAVPRTTWALLLQRGVARRVQHHGRPLPLPLAGCRWGGRGQGGPGPGGSNGQRRRGAEGSRQGQASGGWGWGGGAHGSSGLVALQMEGC